METIDLTPTWEACFKIYLAVLQNPEASTEAVQTAHEELLRAARALDMYIAEYKKGVANEER